jgi:hypothetical protein
MLEKAESQERSDRGILCAKCEHLNVRGANQCSRCGSHLYISCVNCGHRTERVRTRCDHCGRKLHRGLFQRYGRRIKANLSLTPLQVILFVIGIAIVFGFIVLVASVPMPSLF